MGKKPHKHKEEEEEEVEDTEEETEEEEEEDEDEKPKKKKKKADEEDDVDDDEDQEGDDDDSEDDDEENAEGDEDSDDEEDEEEDAEEDEGDEGDSKESWLMTGVRAERAKKQHQATAQAKYRPEMWLAKDETRRIRFMSADAPLIFVHNVAYQVGKRRFQKYTCSGNAKCAFCQSGLSSSASRIYYVHDFTPYTDKNGKEVKQSAKFFPLNETRHAQVQDINKNLKGKLTDWIVEVKRYGEGTATTYSFMAVEQKPMSKSEKALPDLSEKIKSSYAPLSVKEQRIICDRLGASGDE